MSLFELVSRFVNSSFCTTEYVNNVVCFMWKTYMLPLSLPWH